MADDIRQRIIASAFSKRSPSGSLEEQYIAHIKIYEDAAPGNDEGGKKARYILLSLTLKGPALIHKSRENPNGSFSIGKTWDLSELTALEVSGRNPGFDITFARRYRWQTESWDDQEAFLIATVRLYRRIIGGQTPQLIGWKMPAGTGASTASRSSAATSAVGEDSNSNRSATPPLPNVGRRLQVSTNSASDPPRSSSPNMLTPRQMASGFRSASPTRQGMLKAPTPGKSSFDQPSPSTGRSTGPLNGGRRSPSPGPSPRSAYQNAPSPGRSPLAPRTEAVSPVPRERTPSNARETGPSRLGRRPTESERPSYDRDRSRENGLPSTPRRSGGARSDRTASPPPNWDVPPQGSRYPPPRSDRAPSPQPQPQAEQTPYRNGIPASPRRPRAGSRSDRAPSPSPLPDSVPQVPPLNPRRDRERDRERDRAPSPNPPSEPSVRRPRAGSRSERAPSPNPIPETPALRRPRAGSRSDREPSRGPSPAPPPSEIMPTPRAGPRVDRELPPVDTSNTSSKRAAKPRIAPTSTPTSSRTAPPLAQVELADPRERLPMPVSLGQGVRKDPYARISFYDPANQAAADRLLAISGDLGEEESNEATMANIEEMLEGYEWSSISNVGMWGESKGAADQIEARLLKELSALDAANMYSFVEADDRVTTVLTYIEEALKEIEEMDGSINSYNIHLNAVTDDISYIQSQNRGLQVQTQNQRALLKELEDLLQTVQVDREALLTLTNQSLEKRSGLSRLEDAATELYKALQAGKDTDMAASMQRLDEYRTYNQQFCQRVLDFLSMMISYQTDNVLKGKDSKPDPLVITSHRSMEDHLVSYAGLIRYMKEMDETRYGKLCGSYFGAASQLYKDQVKILLDAYLGLVRRVTDEESDLNFAPSSSTALSRGATMRRAGTIVRSPLDMRTKDKDKDKGKIGELRGYEAFGKILDQISPLTYKEEEFLSSFLQINETGETFADYMSLDSYFRRQAARWVGLSRETQKLLRGAMDLIFSFLPDGLKKWIDDVLELDKIQMIGIIAHLERYKLDAEERGNTFLSRFLQKQHSRVMTHQARHVDELIKSIEATKLSSKKRKGVVHYIKYFPIFVNRVEGQLTGADGFEIRVVVDTSYEKIVNAMFESLQQMAKLEGEGEDKGQLNYHVILIENMHSFINDLGQQSLGAMAGFTRRAEGIYDENLTAYVRLVLRRPFPKLVDFVDAADKLLKTMSPSDVASSATHNKATLKKLVKDNTAKDVKRNIDAMFKRVEKHFAEGDDAGAGGGGGSAAGVAMPGTVLYVVWKTCEDELVSLTERLLKFISTCHKESSAEYSVADVEAAFKKHKA